MRLLLLLFIILSFNVSEVEASFTEIPNTIIQTGTTTYNNIIDLTGIPIAWSGIDYSLRIDNYDIDVAQNCIGASGGSQPTPPSLSIIVDINISHISPPCDVEAYYYFTFWELGNPSPTEFYYAKYYFNGVTIDEAINPAIYTLVQSEKPQFIEIIKPIYSTTTSTTTIETSVRFETPPPGNGIRPPTARVYVISNAVTQEVEYTYIQVIPAGTIENIVINETIVLTEGSKLMDAYYSDENAKVFSEVDTTFFNVITNSYEIATGLPYPGASPSILLQDEQCAFSDVGCHFRTAMVVVFYPTERALDRFANIWQTLSYVVPFGYLTVTIDQLGTLDYGESAIFSFGELPFQEAIFTPMRTGLGAIMWALFGIFFFNFRLRHLDI